MKSIISFLTALLLFTSCNSNKHFLTRKYTSGRYVSHVGSKHRVDKKIKEQSVTPIIAKNEITRKEILTSDPIKNNENISETSVVIQKIEKEDNMINLLMKKKNHVCTGGLLQAFTKKTIITKERKEVASTSQKPGSKSQLSVILGSVGLVLDIVGFALAIIASEYIFLSILIVGLILGIVGLISGIKGIKEYKREKDNGNKNKSTLILGIIGTSLSGAAIFLAAYLAVYGALFIALEL